MLRKSLAIPQKVKHRIAMQDSNTLIMYITYTSNRTENSQQSTCTQMFIKAKRQKQPKCQSMDKWINKLQYLHTKECYSAIKRNNLRKFWEDGGASTKDLSPHLDNKYTGRISLMQTLELWNLFKACNFQEKVWMAYFG